MPDQLLRETTSLCRECKRTVPAALWRVAGSIEGAERPSDGRARPKAEGAIVIRKRCESHGEQEALVCSDGDWYDDAMSFPPVLVAPIGEARAEAQGCPYDCGPCTSHEQRNHLPVVPITSACNLDCPICYTHNKNGEGAYYMEEGELLAILAHLRRAAPEKRIINITGGEPTLHPKFERLLELCHEEGIKRITVSTHGLTLLGNDRLVKRLKELEARVILSFDSFDEDVNRKMLGGAFGSGKMKVLELLEKHDVDASLLPVLARGMNDHEIDGFVKLALSKDFIRSVEFHPMTFTGQYGASFDRGTRYTAPDALADLETRTGGVLRVKDFVPSPAAHALCYQVAYLLKLGPGRWLPFTRFMRREDLRAMLADTLYLLPGKQMESRLQDVIARLWAGEIDCPESDEVLEALRKLVDSVFSPDLTELERVQTAERATKAIYVHTHMDEETFDTDRIKQCCVAMPSADGSTIPSCAYNILYRERDARFIERPADALVTLGRGRMLSRAS